MSEKQYEECVFQEATHVAVNGVVFQITGNIWKSDQSYLLCWLKEDISIPLEYFSTFGIKPLRERKRKPIEFTYTVGGGIAPPNEAYGKTFLCVEILEEEK